MNQNDRDIPNPFPQNTFAIALVMISLLAISSAFALASSALAFDSKIGGFAAIVTAYLLVCLLVYAWQSRTKSDLPPVRLSDSEIDFRFRELEEACELMGASLSSADMFRLISNKTGELFPLRAYALLLVERGTQQFRTLQTFGEISDNSRTRGDLENCPAARCLMTGLVEVGPGGSAAIPLKRSGEIFAIYHLYTDSPTAFEDSSIPILEAIGERVSPLVLSSIAFDRSLANALTDPVTDLPNERAFHLVLENQIAETQRNREERPLAILSIDIKEFDQLNIRFGHAAGDRILSMVASAVKIHLREMDFFARSTHDEFLAILPTATQEIAEEIVSRIKTGLYSSKFYLTDAESVTPELNFGVATFGADGETAGPLIRAARLQKRQTKTTVPENVLWFPKEFVN